MSLSTNYLGLNLKNPLVPSASPLSRDIDMAKRLEDAGAAAIVMYSLFEEEISSEETEIEQHWDDQDSGNGESSDYLPVHYDYRTTRESYLEQIATLKNSLDIPVIASLNGITASGWTEHARDIQDAGADALELNVYYIPTDMEQSSQFVESRYIDILKLIREEIYLPITIKLSQQFSSPLHFIKQLEQAGTDGVALFNRFFHPDINIHKQEVVRTQLASTPAESLTRLHWIGLLHKRVRLSLAATGGIHTADDAIKMLLAGADVAHLCTVLLARGPEFITEILKEIDDWMARNEYATLAQFKGIACHDNVTDPVAYERVNYMALLRDSSKRFTETVD